MAACRDIAQFSGTALADDTLRVDARQEPGERATDSASDGLKRGEWE
ncbi:MAG: hypothetical protein WB626_10915 [Bacteroidota bacterium]